MHSDDDLWWSLPNLPVTIMRLWARFKPRPPILTTSTLAWNRNVESMNDANWEKAFKQFKRAYGFADDDR